MLISDEARIPTGLAALPIPDGLSSLPDLDMIPTLLVGSFSIAIVALAQGAGIRPAFPNPDESRSSASQDFLGQGLGNVAGALFQSAPTGGSPSRTAVSADSGANSRVAGYLAAFVLASASQADLQRVVHDDEGWLLRDDIPATLPRTSRCCCTMPAPISSRMSRRSSIGFRLPIRRILASSCSTSARCSTTPARC